MVMANRVIVCILLLVFCSAAVNASGLSVTMKRTNPGIAGIKSSEIIFDIVNTDINNGIEAFILCKSPDDVVISSTLGFASASGAQYVSPIFILGKAPSQKSVYLSIASEYAGDYNTNCQLKYIPFTFVDGEKKYVKMNLDVISTPKDSDYRELRLVKSVPVVQSDEFFVSATCPKGEVTCISRDVVLSEYRVQEKMYLLLALVMILISGFMAKNLLQKHKK